MAFGSNSFGGGSRSFDQGLSKSFDDKGTKNRQDFSQLDNPFKFTPKDSNYRSRIRFYDRDALWARWRRGYELYTTTQSVFGSTAGNRSSVGDYRFYCAFQQYPGIFIPARFFTFPSSNTETKEHIVAMRDANSLNFYNFGLPILAVRYLGNAATVPYSQVGNTITVSYPNHGFQPQDNVYLNFLSGQGTNATLSIVSKTANTFTCMASVAITTIGNVLVALSTEFADSRWTEIRAKLRYLPSPTGSIIGERFTDRVSENDPGLVSSYTRIGSTITVTCTTAHGLFTGNEINLNVTSGNASSGLYKITVISTTSFTITTIDTGPSTGSAIVYRLIQKFNYDNYVGYTVKSIDESNTEIVFQRDDSYGAKTVDSDTAMTVPAHRGFLVSRFLTSEIRYQCTCQDYTRRSSYNLYDENQRSKFPQTAITSTKPGTILNKDNSVTDTRENIGTFSDLGYITVNNFYELPDYKDQADTCYTNLMYYQLRWCKHIYAAFFSIVHDEGNTAFDISAKYVQTDSFDIIVTAFDHGLSANTKVAIDFTSGNALSGQYLVNSIIDSNTFVIVYPFSQTTAGYCNVKNIKEHDYISKWLLEPSDHPVGDDSDTFYKNFTKENSRVKQSVERLASLKMGKNWLGTTSTLDFRNQPRSIANYQPTLLTSLITDNVTRNAEGSLSDSGILQNSTQRLISVMSKVVNLEPTLIASTKFGFLNEPLINYTVDYLYGLIDCGGYLNGVPTSNPASNSVIDCDSYSPITQQDVVIDCGVYGT